MKNRIGMINGAIGVAMLAAAGLLQAAEPAKDFHSWAPTPPMGWNSWDCYATTINEAQTRQTADIMARTLLPHGWQYLVVDHQWFEPGARGFKYRKRPVLVMDDYGRLQPATNRFPSAANGAGLKLLADYVHSKGLKFGIHIMRGIARQAVEQNTPIVGTSWRAADIADTNSICKWCDDMYGVDMSKPGAQEYYNARIQQYADWGVDFLKVDDLSRPYHKAEIEAMRKAIDRCGRPIVFSTSPGETPLAENSHVSGHANMWRISDDFWDQWKELKAQFIRLRNWAPYLRPGSYPDADMLPLGDIGMGRRTKFTLDEQRTMMTLWCIAKSPLMLGSDLTKLDDVTLSLITNDEVLAVNQRSSGGRQLSDDNGLITWMADLDGAKCVALFNTTDASADVKVRLADLGLQPGAHVRDLWKREENGACADVLVRTIPAHGAVLCKVSGKMLSFLPATIKVGGVAKAISPDLVGIFFEDLNWAADGGLYAELVQNRSFEYSTADHRDWHALTSWELIQRGAGKGKVAVETVAPLNGNNSHYAVLTVEKAGDGVGLLNSGYDGIPLKGGQNYEFSLFARAVSNQPGPMRVYLESKAGVRLAEAQLPAPSSNWTQVKASLKVDATDPDARLVVLASGAGTVALDMVSLFPQKTFRNRSNGLRADLAQAIADLKPKFMRFPGGCLAHGDGLANIYRWKDTIGPVEQRKEQRNIWGYHQSVGLGYYEYFQFCEDIGASPLPVLAAGVCCQNSGHSRGRGQQGIPLDQMGAYVQDVLDLVEYANGAVTTKWGAERAKAGHPAPFNLKYLGIGNEDAQTGVFRERYKLIHDALKASHPEITVVGTVGPAPDDRDFEEGWKFARAEKLAMVDEHYYRPPDWFWDNLARYDTYDRAGTKVYVGEYAAHDVKRRNTWRSALAEAACLTSLERNADVVSLASYAPLLARRGHTQWSPDLIYFDNTNVSLTPNYTVQQMFSLNSGDQGFPVETTEGPGRAMTKAVNLAVSCVKDSKTEEVILKLVSRADKMIRVAVDLGATGVRDGEASCTLLQGDPVSPKALIPVSSRLPVAPSFTYDVPPMSLAVIRMKAGGHP